MEIGYFISCCPRLVKHACIYNDDEPSPIQKLTTASDSVFCISRVVPKLKSNLHCAPDFLEHCPEHGYKNSGLICRSTEEKIAENKYNPLVLIENII